MKPPRSAFQPRSFLLASVTGSAFRPIATATARCDGGGRTGPVARRSGRPTRTSDGRRPSHTDRCSVHSPSQQTAHSRRLAPRPEPRHPPISDASPHLLRRRREVSPVRVLPAEPAPLAPPELQPAVVPVPRVRVPRTFVGVDAEERFPEPRFRFGFGR
jgi:hypothetical protein